MGRSHKNGAMQKQCTGSFIALLEMAREHVPVAMGSATLDVVRRNSLHDFTFRFFSPKPKFHATTLDGGISFLTKMTPIEKTICQVIFVGDVT